MRIAFDVSPLEGNRSLSHRVRGTGAYIENLKESLLIYYPENTYVFFTQEKKSSDDVDLVHYPYFEPFFLTLPIWKKHRTVVTIHDLTPLVFPKNFPAGLKGFLKWNVQKLLLKNIDVIVTDSKSSKRDIVKYTGAPENKVTVVYLAAGEEFKQIRSASWRTKFPLREASNVQSLRKRYNLPEEFVLYVGDATWNKNLPRLVESFRTLPLHLVLVGSALTNTGIDISNPWNRDLVTVQKLVAENNNVTTVGFIPTDELVLFYNLATLLIMPSRYEGFGLPILEAMSCGCPVVTSKAGSIPEIGGDAVYYIDPYNIDSISEGILTVFSNKKLQSELSIKGLQQAKKFSWKKTAEETLEVYEKKNTASH